MEIGFAFTNHQVMAIHHLIMAWLKEHAWWVMLGSVLFFGVGMGVALLVAVRLPADFFLRDRTAEMASRGHPVLRFVLRLLKNLAGFLLVIAGVIMALPMVPGPGVLLIFLGVSLVDIPPIRSLQRRFLRSRLVLNRVNALRARWKQPPFQMPARAVRRKSRSKAETKNRGQKIGRT